MIPNKMDDVDYCFFALRKKADSLTGINYHPRSDNLNLEKLRSELWTYFEIPKDRRIFYFDEDNDIIPIDSEWEFCEVWKFARKATVDKPIQLIVGSYNLHLLQSSSDDENINLHKLKIENNSSNEQKRDIDSNPSHPKSLFKLGQRHVHEKSPLMKKWDKRRYKSNKEQKESKDMETPKELNASLRFGLYSDTPPSWFIEYMESMKKDMIFTISHEVTKNVTETLNKYLDFPTFSSSKKLLIEQLPFSASLNQHSEYCCNSNDKKQKNIIHQDEEQSSDASIERVDEPQDISEDLCAKRNVQSTFRTTIGYKSNKKEMTETPNETIQNCPAHVSFKKICYENQSHLPFTKEFSQHSFDKKIQEKYIKFLDAEQLSDDASIEHVDELQDINITEHPQLLQEKINLLQDAICDYANANTKKKRKKKKQYCQQMTQTNSKNIDNNICKEQQLSSKKNEFIPQKDLFLQVDQKSYDERLHLETLKMLENELRMSCSVTGHQMLDENCHNKNIWSFNDLHIDSDSLEVDDDDAFEIIQMPKDESHLEETITKQHDSSQDSFSFELLSELSNSTCINDDPPINKKTEERVKPEEKSESTEKSEITILEEKVEQNSNLSKFTYVIDKNGKIHGYYGKKKSFHHMIKTAPGEHWDTQCSELSHNCTNSSYSDVRNSHPSYMPMNECKIPQWRSCQSQTDLIDFSQSFHSHTTSVTTDTTDTINSTEIYACHNGRYEQMPTISRNPQEMAATKQEMTMSMTVKNVEETSPMAAANSRNDFVGSDWEKEAKTNEKHHSYDANGNSRITVTCSISDDSASQQFHRMNRSSDKPISNEVLQRRCVNEPLGVADPVHILPETLVTAAAQVGTYAYVAARELFDKLRTHAKEDAKRRNKMR